MGLDIYFFAGIKEPDKYIINPDDREEIAYWRKANHIQNWFQEEFKKLNPHESVEELNCLPFPITKDMLDRFESDIREERMKPVGGFFFGNTNYDPAEEKEDDLKAVAAARDAMAEGKQVVFYSWW